MNKRDRYGFKYLKPGEEKMLFGVAPHNAQQCFYRYCERYPFMCRKEFTWQAIKGGVVVTRIR